MKVVLSTPPAFFGDSNRHFMSGNRWGYTLYDRKVSDGLCPSHYPFFLGYSSALLKKEGNIKVKAIDATAKDMRDSQLITLVGSEKPDLLIVEAPTTSFPLMTKILQRIKEDTGCIIAVSGAHATALADEILRSQPYIDFCLLGEYEQIAEELVLDLEEYCLQPSKLREIKGLAFRNEDKVIVNDRRGLLSDLDSLPFPDRDDLPIELYHDFDIYDKPCAIIQSSRGCPFSCSFCVERNVIYNSPQYRTRKPERVVDEMELVKMRHGARQIYFDDQSISINKKHLNQLCAEIRSRRLDIPWTAMADLTLDLNTLKTMKKSGCVGIKFGVETVSQNTLNQIGKPFVTENRATTVTKWCRQLGIFTHATYIVGLPYESKESILRTIRFASKCDTDSWQISIATPHPGTPFYEMVKKNGWISTHDWTRYDGANYSVLSYPWLSGEEIEKLLSYGKRELIRSTIYNYIQHPKRSLRFLNRYGMDGLLTIFRYAKPYLLS